MIRSCFAVVLVVLAAPVVGYAQTAHFDAAVQPIERAMKFRLGLDLPVLRWGDAVAYGRYDQRSMWDLDNDDDPFRVESNHAPSFGARYQSRVGWIGSYYVHESNGLEGELSRGWNRIAVVVGRDVGPWALGLAGWWAFAVESTNADLTSTVGDGEFTLRYDGAHPLRPELRARYTLDPIDRSVVTSLRLALTASPPTWLVPDRRGRLLLEAFWGRGEMLQQNERITRAIRLGVAIALGR